MAQEGLSIDYGDDVALKQRQSTLQTNGWGDANTLDLKLISLAKLPASPIGSTAHNQTLSYAIAILRAEDQYLRLSFELGLNENAHQTFVICSE